MSSWSGRLRHAVAVNTKAPTVWLTAAFALVGLAVAAGIRDVRLSHLLAAGVIGLVAAVLSTVAAREVTKLRIRRGRVAAGPQVPRLPGTFASRLLSGIGTALRDWRHNLYARLALRRVVVLAPLVAVLEARRDPVALYALVVAFSITQPTAADTLDRALARTAGVIAAILVTVAIGAVAPDWVLIAFSVAAMVAGLAYLLRSPFVIALGTTVLTVATGYLAGSSTAAANRLLSTVAGGAVGLLATLLIPVPKPPERPVIRAPADPEAV
jgi:hypothetical protein